MSEKMPQPIRHKTKKRVISPINSTANVNADVIAKVCSPLVRSLALSRSLPMALARGIAVRQMGFEGALFFPEDAFIIPLRTRWHRSRSHKNSLPDDGSTPTPTPNHKTPDRLKPTSPMGKSLTTKIASPTRHSSTRGTLIARSQGVAVLELMPYHAMLVEYVNRLYGYKAIDRIHFLPCDFDSLRHH